jgi:hypothetical protein
MNGISVRQAAEQWQRDKSIGLNEALVPPIKLLIYTYFPVQ